MTITDALALVVSPGGTAASAHLPGIDFAGKTGSAQTVSNELKKKMSASEKSKFKDNGWFVGVTPRRNPELVVAVLLEEGEHGFFAARAASQVIKAYVEKQRKSADASGQGERREWQIRPRSQRSGMTATLSPATINCRADTSRFRWIPQGQAGSSCSGRNAEADHDSADVDPGSDRVTYRDGES